MRLVLCRRRCGRNRASCRSRALVHDRSSAASVSRMITARNESAPVAGYLEVASRVTSPLPSLRPLSAPMATTFSQFSLVINQKPQLACRSTIHRKNQCTACALSGEGFYIKKLQRDRALAVFVERGCKVVFGCFIDWLRRSRCIPI